MQHILGQSNAIRLLQRALASGRVHHAWIFKGPQGVGKFTTAIEFAKLLLDPDATTDPAGRIARMVDAGRHPDLHIIRKELSEFSSDSRVRSSKQRAISIEILRERMVGGGVGDTFHDAVAWQTPTLGHNKVFIIDEAELLAPVAQNALLKTLEEPPPGTYIILVTTDAEGLLPTIRSRCQPVPFTPLDEASMRAWFDRYRGDGQRAERDEQQWIETFAAGAPGLAKLAIEKDLYQWRQTLLPYLRQADAGVLHASFGETMGALVAEYAEAAVQGQKRASKEAANHEAARLLLMLLASHLTRRLAERIIAGGDFEPTLRLIEMLRDNEHAITRNVNLKLVFENIAAQWADICTPMAA